MLNKLNRKRTFRIGGAIVCIAAFAAVMLTIGFALHSAPRSTVSHNTKIQTVYQPFTSATASCSSLQKTVVTTDLEEEEKGYQPSQFTIGDGPFKSLGLVYDTGSADFSAKPILDSTELEAYLTSGSPSAEAQIQQAMTNTGATNAQVLDIENWEGFQLLIKSTWSGNTMYVNGKVETGPVLHVPKGDIGWMFVSPVDCGSTTSTVVSSVKTYITRGPCGNEEMTLPTPYTTPPTTPTPTTPGTPRPTPKSSCGCTTKTQVEIPPQANPSPSGTTGSPTPTAPTSPPSQSPDPPTPPPATPTPTPNPGGGGDPSPNPPTPPAPPPPA